MALQESAFDLGQRQSTLFVNVRACVQEGKRWAREVIKRVRGAHSLPVKMDVCTCA